MIPVHSSRRVREHDQALIDDWGIPSRQLMEIAGRECAATIHRRWPRASVALYCGPGNNGGDGFVVARWLHLWGHDCQIVCATPPKTVDARVNLELCVAMGLKPVSTPEPASLLVDALLGTGQNAAPRGDIATLVHAIQERSQAGVQVVSIDLPTGLCSDTGLPFDHQCAVSANVTLTLGYLKPGLLLRPGLGRVGEVSCIDIGLDLAHQGHTELATPEFWLLEKEDIDHWTPHRAVGDAKWNQGHIAILGKGGAAVLAAHGAFRAGAGLVSLVAPKNHWADLHGLWPEVILTEAIDYHRHDVVVMGPGLGTDQDEPVLRHWTQFPGTLVADADAISILARQSTPPPSGGPRILTPHSAEAARLLRVTRDDIEEDRLSAARALGKWGTTILKGPHSIISGNEIWMNPTGCSRLATAGSGDVLAGHIGGYAARGPTPPQATAIAAWRHGLASETMAENATSSDLIEALR